MGPDQPGGARRHRGGRRTGAGRADHRQRAAGGVGEQARRQRRRRRRDHRRGAGLDQNDARDRRQCCDPRMPRRGRWRSPRSRDPWAEALVRDGDVVDVAGEVVAGRVIWSQFSLPAIEIGRLLVMLPELPLRCGHDRAVDGQREALAVRAQRATCHWPSLRTPEHDLLSQEAPGRVGAAEDARQLAVRVLELEVAARRRRPGPSGRCCRSASSSGSGA